MSSRSKDSRELDQGGEFGGAAQDRLGHFAGQLAVENLQFVGAVFLEPDHGGDRVGEQRKAARDQAGIGAVGAHGHDQFTAARRWRDALFQTSSTTLTGMSFKQRDALAQRRLELDFAAHRAFGDGGDMRLQPGEIGQFVDAFLADHGGIHVGEKKLLAPERAGCTTMSIGRSPRAWRRRASIALMSSLPVKGIRPRPRRTAIALIRARAARPARRRRSWSRARGWRDCR